MLPILQVGPLSLQFPALLLLVGFWEGLRQTEKAAERFGLSAHDMANLGFTAIIGGILGARIMYILQFPDVFFQYPLNMVSLNPALLSLEGGLLFGVVAALIYGQRKELPFWKTLDALVLGAAVFQIALGASHLASGAAYGIQTGLPWGIRLLGAVRHPTQVYESLVGIVIFLILRRKMKAGKEQPGVLFLIWLSIASAGVILVDAFRANVTTTAGGLHVTQILAWIALAAGLIGLGRNQKALQQEVAG